MEKGSVTVRNVILSAENIKLIKKRNSTRQNLVDGDVCSGEATGGS